MSRFERPRDFLCRRFSCESHLGLHLTIGLVVILITGWCFSEIAEHVAPTAQQAVDQEVTDWFHTHAQPSLTRVALFVSFFGSVGFLTTATLFCAVVFARGRAWARFWLTVNAMLGGSLLNLALKHFFHRQRPILENPLVTLSSYGFPSGHTMGATIFYGTLAIIAGHWLNDWHRRLVAIALAVLMIAAVGLTRIYLGAHYLTDVLAAIAAGSAWLTFCWTGIETFRKSRASVSC